MRVRDSGTDLMVDDQVTFGRWVGAVNFLIAGGCTVIAVVHYQPGGEWRDVFLLLVVPFAAALALAGLWRALAPSATILRVDREGVTLARRVGLGRVTERWPPAQVARFGRTQRTRHDGAAVYRLNLDLVDGRSLPACALWHADASVVDALASRANALLEK